MLSFSRLSRNSISIQNHTHAHTFSIWNIICEKFQIKYIFGTWYVLIERSLWYRCLNAFAIFISISFLLLSKTIENDEFSMDAHVPRILCSFSKEYCQFPWKQKKMYTFYSQTMRSTSWKRTHTHTHIHHTHRTINHTTKTNCYRMIFPLSKLSELSHIGWLAS